jgi:glycerol-3-phosphate dehydrogenase
VDGVVARDEESSRELRVGAEVVVNAAGPFCDAVRRLAEPDVGPLIAPSQGIHLVFDGSYLPGGSAIMVPHTSDGRVMFAIPWHGHTVVGTTDTPIEEPLLEPRALAEEIEFILETAGRYLQRSVTRADVRSVFVGIRPLVRAGDATSTAVLSRDHTIHIDNTGLITLTGGKWTTYRNMAEDCVNQAATLAHLPEKPCPTRDLNIHGFHRQASRFGPLAVYGSDALHIRDLIRSEPELEEPLHPALPYCGAEVVWAARFEMARTVEDVLARRTRALFLEAQAALEMAPRVAELLARELQRDEAWGRAQVEAFGQIAQGYLID